MAISWFIFVWFPFVPAFVLKTTWVLKECEIGTNFFFLVVTYNVAEKVLLDNSLWWIYLLYFLSVLVFYI